MAISDEPTAQLLHHMIVVRRHVARLALDPVSTRRPPVCRGSLASKVFQAHKHFQSIAISGLRHTMARGASKNNSAQGSMRDGRGRRMCDGSRYGVLIADLRVSSGDGSRSMPCGLPSSAGLSAAWAICVYRLAAHSNQPARAALPAFGACALAAMLLMPASHLKSCALSRVLRVRLHAWPGLLQGK